MIRPRITNSMKYNLSLYLLTILLICITLVSQGQDLLIKRATTAITIDGVMDEGAWKEADVADRFNQIFPYDSSEAIASTEVRMTYDDDFVYLIAIMHNLGPRKYITPSLRRDFRGRGFDSFTLILDTYKVQGNTSTVHA